MQAYKYKKFTSPLLLALFLLGLILMVSNLSAQEDKEGGIGLSPEPIPKISPVLQDIIDNDPNQTVNIFIALSFNSGYEIKQKVDASEIGVRKRELQIRLQEMSATDVRGDSPEHMALEEEYENVSDEWTREFSSQLDEAYKPAQDQVSNLVESLGGEVIYRYTISNLLAVRIRAQQIPDLFNSNLVGYVYEDSPMVGLGNEGRSLTWLWILIALVIIIVVWLMMRKK